MIAQDHTKHPGSIIRINLDGSVPKIIQNLLIKDWLPEIYLVLGILKECLSHLLITKYT